MEETILFPHEQHKKVKSRQTRLALVSPQMTGASTYTLAFVHRMLDTLDDHLPFWLNAKTIKDVQESYEDILSILGAPFWERGKSFDWSGTQVFLKHLNWTHEGNWLVVLDGLTRESALYLTLENLLPQGLDGSLLITTDDASCLGLLNPVEIIQIPEADWIRREHVLDVAEEDVSQTLEDGNQGLQVGDNSGSINPLSITASVVGITVPALHGVRLLLEDLQQLREAPKTITRLLKDVQSVDTSLNLLRGVEEREWDLLGPSVLEESKSTISSCTQACHLFRTDLHRWTRHSKGGKLTFQDRTSVEFFKQRQIKTMSEQLQNCMLLITSVVSVAAL